MSSADGGKSLDSQPRSSGVSPKRVWAWRGRSWCRSAPKRIKTTRHKRRGLAWRERSISFSTSKTNSPVKTSPSFQDLSLRPSVGLDDIPPVDAALPAIAVPQGPNPQCLLCQMHLTGKALMSMEEMVDQLLPTLDPLNGAGDHGALYRLPYSVIWPGNAFYQ